IESSLSQGLDDVLAALSGSEITVANFQTVSLRTDFSGARTQTLAWDFLWSVPLAKMKEANTTLSNLQKAIVQKPGNFTMTYSLNSSLYSFTTSTEQSAPCDLACLISDARTHAQTIATAACSVA